MLFGGLIKKVLRFEEYAGHSFLATFNACPTIVDLGAGKGEFSKLIMSRWPRAQITLVEPIPDLAEQLHMEYKDGSNVKVINACIATRSSNDVKFYLSNTYKASSLNKNFAEQKGLSGEVNVRTIDLREILSSLTKIDLLKIDIEGAEWDVLESLSKRDFGLVDQVSIEFHDFLDPSCRPRSEKCIGILKKDGYLFVHHGEFFGDCLFVRPKCIRDALIKGVGLRT